MTDRRAGAGQKVIMHKNHLSFQCRWANKHNNSSTIKKNILKQMSKTCIKNNIFYKENIRYWISYWILNYTFNKHGKFDFPQAQIVIINCTFMWICKFSHRDIFLNSLFIKRSSADKKLWLTDGRTDFCLQNAPNFSFMNFCCSFLALLFFKINFKEGKL